MDGGKKKLTGSLQFRLSATLSTLIALLAIGAGVFSYMTAFDEAIEWQDANLRQMSAMTDGHNARVDLPVTIIDTIPDPDLEVVVEVLGPANVAHLGGPLKVTQPRRGTACRPSMSTARPGGCSRARSERQPARGGAALGGARRGRPRERAAGDRAAGGADPGADRPGQRRRAAGAQADDGAGRATSTSEPSTTWPRSAPTACRTSSGPSWPRSTSCSPGWTRRWPGSAGSSPWRRTSCARR